ncbi:MAG: hypothetical protein EOM59_22225 [Clostridia bacterium]|nr:hypothetical protein [Clostridia bacterium]
MNKLYLLPIKGVEVFFRMVLKDESRAKKLYDRLGFKTEWEVEYELNFIVRDKSEAVPSCPALNFLARRAIDDKDDYKRLVQTIKMQLSQKRVPYNPGRVSVGKPQSEIIEFKAKCGKSRLFGFVHRDKIICTHGYMKDDSHSEQNDEFEKAEQMRIRFLEQENDYE